MGQHQDIVSRASIPFHKQSLSRAAWIRTEEGSAPLHEPERVAVALERVYAIMQQPIAGPMAHRDR